MTGASRARARLRRGLETAARLLAWLGGLVLVAIAVMTVVSVSGRALVPLGLGPVPGDFELVEMGTAVAVFSFLPWCQLRRGHVTVDILVDRFPPRLAALFQFLGDLVLLAFAALIAWRLWFGFGEKLPYLDQPLRDALGFGYKPFFPETTYILGMPVWYGFALALPGALLFVLAALLTAWESAAAILAGHGPAQGEVVE
ncbi:MAG: TRAP transporter small permease [Alphaproteobacteria bacterium]|nr:MAG: TRAP transporter small permease [Alphaproteobacteria bacterium]